MGMKLLSILFLSYLFVQCSGVYFYLADNAKSCFVQEVPDDTPVVAKYANIDIDHHGLGYNNHPVTILITVMDPNRQQVVSHEALKKGSVAWTSEKEGEYQICVEMQNSPRKGRTFKFGLTFAHADQTVDYTALAKQEHLSALVVELRRMNDRVSARRSEQLYQRSLEEKFRDETEDMNGKVMYWSFFQSLVILGSVVYQIIKLRRFFANRLNK